RAPREEHVATQTQSSGADLKQVNVPTDAAAKATCRDRGICRQTRIQHVVAREVGRRPSQIEHERPGRAGIERLCVRPGHQDEHRQHECQREPVHYLFLTGATLTPSSLARSIDCLMNPDARISATNASIAARRLALPLATTNDWSTSRKLSGSARSLPAAAATAS